MNKNAAFANKASVSSDDSHCDKGVENGANSTSTRRVCEADGVFGEIKEGDVNYRDVGWRGTAMLMMKTQIGLGVLAIPQALHVLGMIPGVIYLLVVGGITWWSGQQVGAFKLNHRNVYGIDDVGEMIAGKPGKIIMGIVFFLFWIFCAGAAMLGISTALNAVSSHATCTAIYVGIAGLVLLALASIPTLGKISWLAWVGVACILTSISALTIAVGVQERPAAAPQTGAFESDWKWFGNPTFTEAASSISTILFAHAGTPAFYPIVSEMREPKDFPKALAFCQGTVTVTYAVIGIVVYYFGRSFVSSPALGSAGAVTKLVCFGLALPGLLVSGVIMLHLPSKYVLVRALQGTPHLTTNSNIHWAVWFGSTVTGTILAYIIASTLPEFGNLVSLVGALFETSNHKVETWCPMGFFVITAGTFLMVAETYGSIVEMTNIYKAGAGSTAFGCADNSDSASGPH